MKNRIDAFAGSKHFKVNQVAEGIYAAISVPGTGSVGNAAIIDLGDTTLVVDTFTTIKAAEDLLKAATYLTGKAVSYVVNTHWHSDHTTGNQVFTPTAHIISTSITREIMETFGKDRWTQQLSNPEPIVRGIDEMEEKLKQETNGKFKKELQWEIASEREYMNALPQLVYTLPTFTFNHQLSIHGSDRIVKLISYGGGHTQSDTFVYLPEDKIVITGDLVLSKHHPVMIHASPVEWLNILEQIEILDIETIIPGHGEICSIKELHEVRGYLKEIVQLVKNSIQNKENIDDILIPKMYQDWYFTNYFRANLNTIYTLMTSTGTK
ncbi:glyoxylase-like metal-dependent hydrolase (beta-lactamase superfamily II) [Bacillus mesophilus]|uniref:MBL fold metallo-hydrolase n=1 Tax=Bacillus mesophilus TaxID=1808955 RepID=A0A6M0Q879_9BACI|nr:MBL fold metallo-hydrolase [Bacillus mesophilus]MBM7662089.1 glyoxylase-like metal-dependent hydrolase (beta-lactamase superfamily II) [Bacillus mesophilus]NEY72556.1 MBL fold metallo-hydrolase [Bacillus mesophilus]